MKKMTKLIALFLVLVMAVSVGACGIARRTPDKEAESLAPAVVDQDSSGTYTLFAIETGGYLVDSNALEMTSVITLNADGKGYLTINEEGGEISSWAVAGESITIVSGVSTMHGVLSGGVIVLDIDNEYVYYFAKEGADTSRYQVMTKDEFIEAGGAIPGLLSIGRDYYYGTGPEGYDPEKAKEYFMVAQSEGSADAWYYLAKLFERSTEEDHYDLMSDCIENAIEQGSPLGYYAKGRSYLYGLGVKKDYEEARNYYQQAIALGCEEANNGLGCLYADGLGVDKDYNQALLYFNAALNGEEFGLVHSAEVHIGDLYYYGDDDFAVDYEEAVKWYQQAADAGYSDGYAALGKAYQDGKGVEQNYDEAIRNYELAVDHGDISSMRRLGYLYAFNEDFQPDYDKAMEWFKKAVKAGDTYAYSYIADMYMEGLGVSPNYKKAANYYKKALSSGENISYCATTLGDLYYFEEYGMKKYKTALKYFKKASKAGSTYSTARVGGCYFFGNGVKTNYKKALKYFRAAAKKGNWLGQYFMGNAYFGGAGVSKNYSTAMKWYKKAAKQEDGYAMKMIGYMYFKGLGVKQNNKAAKKWFKKALKSGDLIKEEEKNVKNWLKQIG